MSIQIVHYRYYLLLCRIMDIKKATNEERPIILCSFAFNLRSHIPSKKALSKNYSATPKKYSSALWKLPDFAAAIARLHLPMSCIGFSRLGRIVRTLLSIQHIFHASHKLGIVVKQYLPIITKVRLKFFFRTLCTLIGEICFIISNSTSFSAKNLIVYLIRPSGNSLQASCVNLVSKTPSKIKGLLFSLRTEVG